MTDNEIIKALECCISEYGVKDCDICPNNEYGCTEALPWIALDLINRQKAEIKRLTKTLADRECSCGELAAALQTANELLKTEKSEAIKEFAERLKEQKYCAHYKLENEEFRKLQSAQRKAFDDVKTAIDNLANWQADMADRYGNGETVKIGNIPNEELKRGEKLELTVKEALEIDEKIDKKFSKFIENWQKIRRYRDERVNINDGGRTGGAIHIRRDNGGGDN